MSMYDDFYTQQITSIPLIELVDTSSKSDPHHHTKYNPQST